MYIKREKFIIIRYKHAQHTQTNLYYIIILYYYIILCYILYYIWNKLFRFTHPQLSWPVSIPRHLCEQTIKITFSPPTLTFALMQLWNSNLVSIFNIVSRVYDIIWFQVSVYGSRYSRIDQMKLAQDSL